MADKTDISLETADCLVHKTGLGSDVIHNICTGATRTIPWEAGDWVAASFFVLLPLLLIAFLALVIREMALNW